MLTDCNDIVIYLGGNVHDSICNKLVYSFRYMV